MKSKREETEKKAKKEAELQTKEQAKREAESNNIRGMSRPLLTPPKLLLLIAVVIILAIIGYGIWLSMMIP